LNEKVPQSYFIIIKILKMTYQCKITDFAVKKSPLLEIPNTKEETLVHLTSLVGLYLKQSLNEKTVKCLEQKYTHFDLCFDGNYCQDMFKMKFQRQLQIQWTDLPTDETGQLKFNLEEI
jgi:hypothetical protein